MTLTCSASFSFRDGGPAVPRRPPARLQSWWRLCGLGLLLIVVAGASGCASYLSAQVTSFHQAGDQRFAGRRFVISPTREQAESLEFRAYADLVRDALARQGMVPGAEADAELDVAMRYSIDKGSAVTYGYPAYGYASYGPVWGWTPYVGPGGMVHYTWTATYPMGYGVVGTSYAQALVYRRELRIEINDRRAAGKDGKPVRLFEGTVVTEGESASLAPVMPAMVRALFSDFPGPSGVSRRVEVRLDEEPPAAAPAGASGRTR